ncbi:MAG: efflux RND transporter periplasmic adaptor subunit [Tepidisphaerales bacterium]
MKRLRSIIRNSLVTLVAAGVVIAAMAWLSGYFHKGKIEPAKLSAVSRPAVGVAVKVERVTRPLFAEVVGSIQAEARTAVSARLVANIIEMRVQAGDRVAKGQLLVVLDDAGPKSRVAQAQEALRSAEASRDLAETEYNRLKPVVERGAASRTDLDQWQSRLAAGKAEVERLKQGIKEAEVNLADAKILSPIDGIVIDRQAEPGEQASPGRPLLTLYDPARLRLEASVRETHIGHLAIGQKIGIHIDSLGEERQGTVTQIVPAADPASRSFLVKVTIADPSRLYPGMYARMRLPIDKQEQLEIPAAAVTRVGQLTYVHVLAGGASELRAVRLGHETGNRIEVLAGVAEGEQVLADGSK